MLQFPPQQSRRERAIAAHLRPRLPRLLQLAKRPQAPEMLWESDALLVLRAMVMPNPHIGSFIQQLTCVWLEEQEAAIPSLMSVTPTPTRCFHDLVSSWEADAVDRRQPSTPENPASGDEDPDDPEASELCPVCMVAPLAAMARPCGHKFCGACLSLCARARLPEPLCCPLCRTPVDCQDPIGNAEVTPLPELPTEAPIPDGPPRRRPRVNEQFLERTGTAHLPQLRGPGPPHWTTTTTPG